MPAPITLWTHEFFPKKGGIAVYVRELAAAAAACYPQRGVRVYAPKHEGDGEGEDFPFAWRGLAGVRGSHNPRCVLACLRALRREEGLESSDVCLAEPGPIMAAMLLESWGGLKVGRLSLVLHGSEIARFGVHPLWRPLFPALLRRAAKVGVVSGFNERELARRFSGMEGRVCLVPGAPAKAFFVAQPPRKEGGPLRLLAVGRIHPRKGQHAVVEALGLLPESLRARVVFCLVGPVVSARYRRWIETCAQTSGVALEFMGVVPDAALPAVYQDADIVTMTSLPYRRSVEGLGIVLLEAGACGLPVVAHRIGGVPDAVEEGQTGFLADPMDRSSLARALQRLLEDADLRRTMGSRGRTHAGQFSWEQNARTLFD